MAHLSHIGVQHIRTHTLYETTLSPGVTMITGSNGAGKTSLIEAIYGSLQGTSFKGSDGDMLQRGATWYRIDTVDDEGGVRTVKFDSTRSTGRRQFIIDEKTNYRLLPAYKYPVVLFEPDDLRLLGGSPARRRQFIDRLISQVDPKYATALRRYERALRQRNALLKSPAYRDDALFAWDVTLSDYGAYVIEQRHHFISMLNQELSATYRTIATTSDSVSVRYSQPALENTRQKLLASLQGALGRDRLVGFTSYGPHRDDVIFEFNGLPAASVASRGEIRSMLLAIKFIEAQILENRLDKKPIILLDDVFSELDERRQTNLVTEFTDHQVIITSVAAVAIDHSQIVELK